MKPRGIRNKNPGNIRWGDPWQGLVPPSERTDKDFCQFVSCPYGIRALARVLITYQDKYSLRTVRELISRWAPPNENDTSAYIAAVASQVGVGPDVMLDMHSYRQLRPVVEAIIRHENGRGHLGTPNTWYEADVINKGLELAGIEAPTREVAKLPVTKETVGASTVGGIGMISVLDSAPKIIESLSRAGEAMTLTSAIVLIGGLALIGAALVITWSQVSKHRRGLS